MDKINDDTIDYNKSFDPEFNNNEDYKLLNEAYEKNLIESEEKINKYFDNLEKVKDKAISYGLNNLEESYNNYIVNIEKEIKEISNKLNNPEKLDSNEIHDLNSKVDALTNSITKDNNSQKYFNNIVSDLVSTFKSLSIYEIQDPRYTFKVNKNIINFGFKHNNSKTNIICVKDIEPEIYNDYKVIETNVSLNRVFDFSFKINEINNYKSNESMNYLIGYCKTEKPEMNNNKFFENCGLIQSNGYLLTEKTNIIKKKLIDNSLKKDDIIRIKKDSSNSLFIYVNNIEYKLFKHINFSIKVVIFVKSNINEGIFEVIEAI